MKTLIRNYLEEHERKKPPQELVDYDFIEVHLDSGKTVSFRPKGTHIEVRADMDTLITWPLASNAFAVEAVDSRERPENPSRALNGSQTAYIGMLEVTLKEIINAVKNCTIKGIHIPRAN